MRIKNHVLFEVLKNSLRAVVETHGVDCENYPPVKVIVAEGSEVRQIRVVHFRRRGTDRPATTDRTSRSRSRMRGVAFREVHCRLYGLGCACRGKHAVSLAYIDDSGHQVHYRQSGEPRTRFRRNRLQGSDGRVRYVLLLFSSGVHFSLSLTRATYS